MTEVVTVPVPSAPVAPTRWRDTGACAEPGIDPELFFPLDEDGPGGAKARALCGRCPVLEQCRAYALEAGMAAGIWGGLSTKQRERIRRPRAGRTDTTTDTTEGAAVSGADQ